MVMEILTLEARALADAVVVFSDVEDGKAVKLTLRSLKIPFFGGEQNFELDSAEAGLANSDGGQRGRCNRRRTRSTTVTDARSLVLTPISTTIRRCRKTRCRWPFTTILQQQSRI